WFRDRSEKRTVGGMLKYERGIAKPVEGEDALAQMAERLKQLGSAAKAAAEAAPPSVKTPLPRNWSVRELIGHAIEGEGPLGAALYLAVYSIVLVAALWFLRSFTLEWVGLASVTWAIVRAVGRDNDQPRWVLAYLLAAGVALFLYAYAADGGEHQNLFNLV